MVRPHFGPPRFKPRPYEDGHDMASRSQDYHPGSKSRSGVPYNGREFRGRGRPLFTKGLPLMEEPREPWFNHWHSENQDSFRSYSPKMEPHHRRPNRPPYPHHRQSSRSPSRGSLSPRGRPFHNYISDHRSPFQRHFPSHPGSSERGSFRGHRRPPPFQDQQREPRRDFSPRERTYDHPGHGTRRWNEPPLHNGPSQRSPRDMQGRGPCPERWSSEQDSRRHHGSMERQNHRSHSRERAHDDQHHQSHFRTPSWKGVPSETSSYNRSHPEGEMTRPRKRRISEISIPPSNPALEHGHPKLLRRERPLPFSAPRPFGGRPLSLREKSVLVKSRQMRAKSLMAIKVRPLIKPRPPTSSSTWQGTSSAVLALRKKRFQSTVVPLKTVNTKRQRSESTSKNDSHSSSEESDSGKDQVEFRRSLKPRSSPPTEKRDLVVLSHWPPVPSTSKEDSPSKDHSPKSKTHVSTSDDDRDNQQSRDERSPDNRKPGYLDKRVFGRPFNAMQDRYRTGRPFRRPGVGIGSGPMQRPRYLGSPRKPPTPEFSGNIRRPLMESLVTRPFPNQRPMFRKSFSIMNKYRNMRVIRQRGPYNQGPSQRW